MNGKGMCRQGAAVRYRGFATDKERLEMVGERGCITKTTLSTSTQARSSMGLLALASRIFVYVYYNSRNIMPQLFPARSLACWSPVSELGKRGLI